MCLLYVKQSEALHSVQEGDIIVPSKSLQARKSENNHNIRCTIGNIKIYKKWHVSSKYIEYIEEPGKTVCKISQYEQDLLGQTIC